MITDPGYVPVPDVKIDFSDTGSRKIRDDDWTVCQVDILRFHRIYIIFSSDAKCGDHLEHITAKSANAAFAKWTITAHGLIIVSGRKIRGKFESELVIQAYTDPWNSRTYFTD